MPVLILADAKAGTAGVHGVPFLGGRMNLDIRRDASTLELTIGNAGSGSFNLEFAPAYPPWSKAFEPLLEQSMESVCLICCKKLKLKSQGCLHAISRGAPLAFDTQTV